jgi:hypothetical protein
MKRRLFLLSLGVLPLARRRPVWAGSNDGVVANTKVLVVSVIVVSGDRTLSASIDTAALTQRIIRHVNGAVRTAGRELVVYDISQFAEPPPNISFGEVLNAWIRIDLDPVLVDGARSAVAGAVSIEFTRQVVDPKTVTSILANSLSTDPMTLFVSTGGSVDLQSKCDEAAIQQVQEAVTEPYLASNQ